MKIESKFKFFALAFGSLDFKFNKKTSSAFGECKIVINFEAKTEQKMSYPPDFGSLPCAVGKFF